MTPTYVGYFIAAAHTPHTVILSAAKNLPDGEAPFLASPHGRGGKGKRRGGAMIQVVRQAPLSLACASQLPRGGSLHARFCLIPKYVGRSFDSFHSLRMTAPFWVCSTSCHSERSEESFHRDFVFVWISDGQSRITPDSCTDWCSSCGKNQGYSFCRGTIPSGSGK